MKSLQTLFLFSTLFCLAACSTAQRATEYPEVDWDELRKTKPWEATEYYTPVPPVVTPGVHSSAPSDAIVLFDGDDLKEWVSPKFPYGVNMEQNKAFADLTFSTDYSTRDAATWEVKDGQLIVAPEKGGVETVRAFGDVQMHIEWLAPVDPGKESQQYSNSGVFFMGLYEVQILNNYENATYVNGQASSIYKQHPPLVNACRPPGEWQTYDIVFNAPKFDDKDKLITPAYVTVIHNGILTQNHVELLGPTCYIGKPYYVAHPTMLPLSLQDHGNKVRFRNIWIREL